MKRIERLMSNQILQPLDYTSFDDCINCIKENKLIKENMMPKGVMTL
jgi:hypothetical protein